MNAFGTMNAPQDFTVPNPPTDSISCLSFNGTVQDPHNDILIAGAWDNTVSCYEVNSLGGKINSVNPKYQIRHSAPVLCSDFSSTSKTVCFTAGCEGTVKMWDVAQGQNAVMDIGRHDQPIRNMKFIPELNALATSSWDRTVRIWDPRSPNASQVLPLTDKAFGMDAKGPILASCTADRQIHVFDLQTMSKRYQYQSPLEYQPRVLSFFADGQGFCVGCVEGRVAVEYLNEIEAKVRNPTAPRNPNANSFVFKCHRQGSNIYSVNAIDFHPLGTMLTGGSDGVWYTWDKNNKTQIKAFESKKEQCPISAAKFSPNGTMAAYAHSYDWSKGHQGNDARYGNNIYIRYMQPAEVQPKPRTGK